MTKAMEESRAIARFTFRLGHDPVWDAPCVNKVPTDCTGPRVFVSYIAHATAIAARDAEIERLREALAFYAEVSKYPAPLTGGMGALWSDCGEVARRALTAGGQHE